MKNIYSNKNIQMAKAHNNNFKILFSNLKFMVLTLNKDLIYKNYLLIPNFS